MTKAEGALADAAGFGSELNVEVTPTDLKEVALRFQKGNASLGELRVSGPFDMQKLEGRLSIVLAGIDKQLLNLVGAKSGMDFGGTTISSTNEVELAKGGSVITAKGQFDVSSFQLTRTNQTTPRLDLRKQYDVTVDRAQSSRHPAQPGGDRHAERQHAAEGRADQPDADSVGQRQQRARRCRADGWRLPASTWRTGSRSWATSRRQAW